MGCFGITLAILLPLIIAYYVLRDDQFDPESIRGKRVLVTGASSGIGEQVAYRYAELGAKLVITARRKDLLEKVATKCKELGAASVHSVPADMASPAERKEMVAATEKLLGGLDFLILNHALMSLNWWTGAPENMTYLDNVININFHSFVDVTSMLLSALKESQGHIGVVSSIAGKVSFPGASSYCACKQALHGFFSSLRQELRFKNTGVSVTLIVFGPVASDRAIEIAGGMRSPESFLSFAGETDDAADALVRSVSARSYEAYFPSIATVGVFLNRIIPGYIEDYSNLIIMPSEKP